MYCDEHLLMLLGPSSLNLVIKGLVYYSFIGQKKGRTIFFEPSPNKFRILFFYWTKGGKDTLLTEEISLYWLEKKKEKEKTPEEISYFHNSPTLGFFCMCYVLN